MKKFCFLLALLTLLLCSCFSNDSKLPTPQTTPEVTSLAATNTETTAEQSPHEHLFEISRIIKEPTCVEAGEYVSACSCGVEEKREIVATGKHNYCDNV